MKTKTTAASYLTELVNYGGQMVPRGYAYQQLTDIAAAQGHSNPQALADRWMQGNDLRRELDAKKAGK